MIKDTFRSITKVKPVENGSCWYTDTQSMNPWFIAISIDSNLSKTSGSKISKLIPTELSELMSLWLSKKSERFECREIFMQTLQKLYPHNRTYQRQSDKIHCHIFRLLLYVSTLRLYISSTYYFVFTLQLYTILLMD